MRLLGTLNNVRLNVCNVNVLRVQFALNVFVKHLKLNRLLQ
jgi:hypothetical protein